ncbi:MAG TPA: hypothetical protein VLV15_15915 [Dongiaceae bacterium]|nr:hypothetical protein [Dongiaceae bacterium]
MIDMRAVPMRHPSIAALTLATLALAGCNDAQLVNVWRDPDFHGPLKRLLVIAQRRDPTERRLWEDAIADQMMKDDVQAIASYHIYPDEPPGKHAMARAMEDSSIDGALIVRALAPTRETRWVSGWNSVEPRTYYDPWGRGDVIVYRGVHHPGHREVDRIARQQVTVWSAQDDGRMVWAATVEVENPDSRDEMRARFAKGVVPGLKKQGVL